MRINAVWYPVRNWQAAKHFYGELLGLKLNHCNDDMGWAAYGTENGVPIFLVRKPEMAGRGGGATVTLETADFEGLIERLRKVGVKIDDDQPETDTVQLVTAYDPDGNAVEISKPVQ